MTEQHVRMGDAERSQASAELGEHYAQGRLTTEEHAERLDQIWAARTRGELGPIFADLPGGTSLRPAPAYAAGGRPARSGAVGAAGRRFRGLPTPVVAVLVVLIVVAVIAHLPLILLGLGVWFLLARRGHCAAPRMPHRRPHWS